MTDSVTSLEEGLQSFIGRTDVGPSLAAREPISRNLIRQLTDCLGDRNPIYTDETFAKASSHGGIVAPPTALQVYSLPGLVPKAGRHLIDADGARRFVLAPGGIKVPGDDPQRNMLDDLHDMMEEAGYTSPAVTNGWYEYKRYLRPGDHVSFSAPSVEEFFGPKKTGLGEGYFITISQDVTDQNGELVAVMRHRFIRFRPNEGMDAGNGELPQPFPYVPPMEDDLGDLRFDDGPTLETLTLGQVAVGERLPPLVVTLTPTMIIANAIATQDYQNVHHDRDAVQRLGHPDVFMNILTSTGFAGRFVTDWAGPEARVQAATVRLGVPNYPYDEMRIDGTVTEKDDDGRVVVDIAGTNRIGKHLDCQITLTLPT